MNPLIDFEKSAEFNFKKSEAIQSSRLHFRIFIINGIVVAYIPLTFNAVFRDIISERGVLILVPILFLIGILIAATIAYYTMKYREYRLNYVMFYSIGYCFEKNLSLKDIPKEDLPALVQKIHELSRFDKGEIFKGLYTYCFKVSRIYPDWLDSEVS